MAAPDARTRRPIAFLFLGETLLIPHLWPIVEAVIAQAPGQPIELWVATSVHEALLGEWLAALDAPGVRIRRAPGFRRLGPDHADGRNPPLPPKLPLLARLAPLLARRPVVVSAEQTSLWLPTLLPMRTRFVNQLHGAGSMMNRDDRRRRAPWLTLVAAERERDALAAHGVDPARIRVTGYVKASFRQRRGAGLTFGTRRPTILYTPHWQKHRSSWWRWGTRTIDAILADGRYNLIFAPHQRLVEKVPELHALADQLRGRDDVHVDLGSFATVDGSYTAAADVYLGDTSSQVVEFLMQPRPCVFLNALAAEWRGDASYAMWTAGEVVDDPADLIAAIDRAGARHGEYVDAQRRFAAESLGTLDGQAPRRAAQAVMAALHAG